MTKEVIQTDGAPSAIGAYSQAIKVGNTVYLSGQIPLDPTTMEIVAENIEAQTQQAIKNLQAVVLTAGGSFIDVVKLTVYLTDMANFSIVNKILSEHFSAPYPARAVIGVQQLPCNALVEIEGIMVL